MDDAPRQSLCPLCLRPKPAEGECPHCHWPGDVLRSLPQALRPGTVLAGRYRTGKVLGQGGFALTYLALDQSLEIRLCVKEYFPANLALRQDDGSVRIKDPDGAEAFNEGRTRFLHEARILARFEGHPGIVPVRDVFEERGTVYIITGYLEGLTLKQFLREQGGKIPFDRALSLFMPVMDSLRAVHKAGVIHRDVSPENIFLTTEGQVKLLDFGSALALDGADRGFTVVVKPGYAPAEQYEEGGDQGPWTDVYGLAASLYRSLTGLLPPTGPERVAGKALKTPSELGVPLSSSQEAVLLKALAEAPQDRYPDVETFQRALVEADEGAKSGGRRERGGGVFGAAFLLFVALALGGWWGWNGLSPKRLEERGRVRLAAGDPQGALPLLERALARSEGPQRELFLLVAQAQISAGKAREGLASLARVESLGSLPPEGLLLAGEAYRLLDEKEKALAFFREAAQLTGDDPSLWLRTARSALAAGRFDRADEAWRKVLALDPDQPEALEGLASASERKSNLDEAIHLRRQLVERAPTAEGWRNLAALLERKGDDDGLLEARRNVVELEPLGPDWAALGRAFLRLRRPSEAAEAFRRQTQAVPEEGEGWRDLGVALLQAGRAQEAAEALYRASALRSGDALLWENLGRAWKESGRFREAEGAFRRALEIDGARRDWWDELGLSLMAQRRFPEAVEALEKADAGEKTERTYRIHLAEALAASGRDVEARELLRKKTEEPLPVEGALLLARILEGQGAFAEAAEAYERARRLQPGALAPLLGLGRSALSLRHPDRALPFLLEALSLAPEEGETLLLLGRVYLDLKDPDRALIQLKEYLRLRPDDEEGWRLLGEAYLRLGRTDSGGPVVERRPDKKEQGQKGPERKEQEPKKQEIKEQEIEKQEIEKQEPGQEEPTEEISGGESPAGGATTAPVEGALSPDIVPEEPIPERPVPSLALPGRDRTVSQP